jgi:hypothetical protein
MSRLIDKKSKSWLNARRLHFSEDFFVAEKITFHISNDLSSFHLQGQQLFSTSFPKSFLHLGS